MARLRTSTYADGGYPLSAKPAASNSESPRKTQKASPVKRDLRASALDMANPVFAPMTTPAVKPVFAPKVTPLEHPVLTPKATPSGTPARKQRVLKPLALNTTLLQKCSVDDLSSPEKTARKRRDDGLGFLYSKSFVQTAVKRRERRGKAELIDVAVDHTQMTEVSLAQAMGGLTMEEPAKPDLGSDKENSVPRDDLRLDYQVEEEVSHIEDDEVESPGEDIVEEQGPSPEPSFDQDPDSSSGETEDSESSDSSEESGEEVENESPSRQLLNEQNQAAEKSDTENSPEESDEYTEDDSEEDSFHLAPPRRQLFRQKPTVVDSEESEEDSDDESIVDSRRRRQQFHASQNSIPKAHAHDSGTESEYSSEDSDESSDPVNDLARQIETVDLTASSPQRPAASKNIVRPTSSYSQDGQQAALLTYSPSPRVYSKKASPIEIPRPTTPTEKAPSSPRKLNSPSKRPTVRVPTPPHIRPSIDAFWCPEAVLSWNDMHSPAKPPPSPSRKNPASPSSPSPRKLKPEPTVKQLREQRKAFLAKREDLAAAFLTQLDTRISAGKISTMASTTGGIKVLWSTTLRTTAGRANWKRETFRIRMPQPSGETLLIPHERHFCSIELATKVINCENRLYNVLAHEFCHLLTFMISNQRTKPHGKEFKEWGNRVTAEFGRSHGVEVTTLHSYDIEYKYIWACTDCGYQFKRHGKSIDPYRHRCGRCKGALEQIKPVPRGSNTQSSQTSQSSQSADHLTATEKKLTKTPQPAHLSAWTSFRKQHYPRIKQALIDQGTPKPRPAEVNTILGAEYKKFKAEQESKGKKDVPKTETEIEIVVIDDDDDEGEDEDESVEGERNHTPTPTPAVHGHGDESALALPDLAGLRLDD